MPTSSSLKLSSVRPTPNYKTIHGCTTTPSERQQMLQPKISTRRPAACPTQVSLHTSSEVCYIQLHYTFPKQVWVWVREWVSVTRSKCTADLLLTLDGTHLLMVPRSPTTDRMDGQTEGAENTGTEKDRGKKGNGWKDRNRWKIYMHATTEKKTTKKVKEKKMTENGFWRRQIDPLRWSKRGRTEENERGPPHLSSSSQDAFWNLLTHRLVQRERERERGREREGGRERGRIGRG